MGKIGPSSEISVHVLKRNVWTDTVQQPLHTGGFLIVVKVRISAGRRGYPSLIGYEYCDKKTLEQSAQ